MLHAQGTAFTYQGRLNDGTNLATGSYDLAFTLFSSSAGGGQVGAALTNAATTVSNGLFAVTLDFGANFPGADRWLEIGVRTNGGGPFIALAPRQKLTATPYAITAGNLTGTLAAANLAGNYPSAVTFTNAGNSFAGNGTGLTNVNAITVGGLGTNSFWQTGGNTGISPTNGNFLGTRDNQPLEWRVNNGRALRVEPTSGAPNLIGGASNNFAAAGVTGAVIGGGGGNTNGGNYSTVPGGNSNYALGDYSFAAGNRAKAAHPGAFVWADSQNADFSSTASNQFNLRAGGGVRIVTTNGAGMLLDGLPVLVGSGVGVLAWQTVPVPAIQATNHYGYVLTNSQRVTVTLPTNMSIGDTIAVSGGGSGGWKIAQNAGQSIIAGNFTFINNPAPTWTSNAPPLNWFALAASADGSKLVAAVYGGQIYTSSDSGATWTQRTAGLPASAAWTAVASSSDGSKLVATVNNGQIYTSSDSGVTWTVRTGGNGNWRCVASSADGSKLAAGISSGSGFIYVSADSGTNWAAISGTGGSWQALASSADGSILVAGGVSGSLLTLINSGGSWQLLPFSSGINWTAVAISADGGKLVAAENSTSAGNSGLIYTSADAGTTWKVTGAPITNWSALAISADGSKLAASVANGPVYISNNGGVTWKAASAPIAGWAAVASSSDAGKLSAAVYGGGIYTSLPSAQRTTTVGPSGFLSGGQNSAVELQHVGNNQFIPIRHEGNIFVY